MEKWKKQDLFSALSYIPIVEQKEPKKRIESTKSLIPRTIKVTKLMSVVLSTQAMLTGRQSVIQE